VTDERTHVAVDAGKNSADNAGALRRQVYALRAGKLQHLASIQAAAQPVTTSDALRNGRPAWTIEITSMAAPVTINVRPR
jgi:hypothetical protein